MTRTTRPIVHECIAFLRAHPEYQLASGRSLAREISEPSCSNSTWDKARTALSLPPISRAGMVYHKYMTTAKTRKQERKAAFAIYPNTHKIVLDTQRLKIVFYGEGGFKVSEKKTAKAFFASLRLFKLARFELRESNIETGIIVMTLKAEVGRAAA